MKDILFLVFFLAPLTPFAAVSTENKSQHVETYRKELCILLEKNPYDVHAVRTFFEKHKNFSTSDNGEIFCSFLHGLKKFKLPVVDKDYSEPDFFPAAVLRTLLAHGANPRKEYSWEGQYQEITIEPSFEDSLKELAENATPAMKKKWETGLQIIAEWKAEKKTESKKLRDEFRAQYDQQN